MEQEPQALFLILLNNPEENYRFDKQLTPAGRRQHFLIGHEIRNRYIESQGVIGNRYNFSEVEFFATDRDRALESGVSQLGGMYPPDMPMQILNDFQRKNALPPLKVHGAAKIDEELGKLALPFNVLPIFSERDDINFAIHFESSDCPAYQQKRKTLAQSQEFLDLVAPYIEYLAPRLKELTQIEEELDMKTINNICSYIRIANFHKLELKFVPNATDYEK